MTDTYDPASDHLKRRLRRLRTVDAPLDPDQRHRRAVDVEARLRSMRYGHKREEQQ